MRTRRVNPAKQRQAGWFSRPCVRFPEPARTTGYTLFEVLLAVTILMVLTSLAWTPLMKSWGDYRLKESTEHVRATLAGTRIRALDQDRMWQFRFEPGGTHYIRIPYGTQAEDASADPTDGRVSGTLPEGVTFQATENTGTESLPQDQLEGLSNVDDLNGINWSTPIIFHPDGTATRTTFEVVAESNGARMLSVRSLTGGVTVSNPEAESL